MHPFLSRHALSKRSPEPFFLNLFRPRRRRFGNRRRGYSNRRGSYRRNYNGNYNGNYYRSNNNVYNPSTNSFDYSTNNAPYKPVNFQDNYLRDNGFSDSYKPFEFPKAKDYFAENEKFYKPFEFKDFSADIGQPLPQTYKEAIEQYGF